jgi:hypothetical protein
MVLDASWSNSFWVLVARTADTCKQLSIVLAVDDATADFLLTATIVLVTGTTTTDFVCLGFILRSEHALRISNAKSHKLILLKEWKKFHNAGFPLQVWSTFAA